MATFFVGQRVRIVGCEKPANRKYIGDEQRIVRFWAGAAVLDCHPRPDGTNCSELANLEPILPSGHTASAESFQELMDRLSTQRVEKVEEVGV